MRPVINALPDRGGPGRMSRRAFVASAAASLLAGGAFNSLTSARALAASPFEVTKPEPVAIVRRPATPPASAMPAWFARDVQRRARWLPDSVKQFGVEGAHQRRWNSFPDDVRWVLGQMSLPSWMIALVPTATAQDEIFKQLRFIGNLAGPAPASPLAKRVEQLLVFGGAAQLPTPGDRVSGACLGPEGCSAAISRYVLAQLKIEYPRELARMSDQLADSQSSVEMKNLFEQAARTGVVKVQSRPFAMLRPEDVQPGSFTIAQKPGGTHVFGWTRVPAGWGWHPSDKMAIGNTGLPQFGDRMILAQEYVTGNAGAPGESTHNEHGPINSRNIVFIHGTPDLSDPRTNVYAARGSDFILVNLG